MFFTYLCRLQAITSRPTYTTGNLSIFSAILVTEKVLHFVSISDTKRISPLSAVRKKTPKWLYDIIIAANFVVIRITPSLNNSIASRFTKSSTLWIINPLANYARCNNNFQWKMEMENAFVQSPPYLFIWFVYILFERRFRVDSISIEG